VGGINLGMRNSTDASIVYRAGTAAESLLGNFYCISTGQWKGWMYYNTTSDSYIFKTAGSATDKFTISSAGNGTFSGTCTATSFPTGSDERIKENIQEADLDLCYENVKKLNLKYYKMKDEYVSPEYQKDRHNLGFIAQEVEKVFPNAVEERDIYGLSDLKTLNKDQIYTSMFGAMQKLIQVVETQGARIKQLEDRLINAGQ